MKTVVIDYGSGNLRSAAKALAAAGADVEVTADPAAVAAAERIVLPGVGAFADCRAGLDRLPGMVEALDQAVRRQGRPVPRHLRRHAAHGRGRARAWPP